jgi:hypothetical protein
MSVTTLQAQHHLALPYNVPANGRFRYEVESEGPTTTLIMDAVNYSAFTQNKFYTYQGGVAEQVQHSMDLRLPYGGMWYLVVVNKMSAPIAVHFNVWIG